MESSGCPTRNGSLPCGEYNFKTFDTEPVTWSTDEGREGIADERDR